MENEIMDLDQLATYLQRDARELLDAHHFLIHRDALIEPPGERGA